VEFERAVVPSYRLFRRAIGYSFSMRHDLPLTQEEIICRTFCADKLPPGSCSGREPNVGNQAWSGVHCVSSRNLRRHCQEKFIPQATLREIGQRSVGPASCRSNSTPVKGVADRAYVVTLCRISRSAIARNSQSSRSRTRHPQRRKPILVLFNLSLRDEAKALLDESALILGKPRSTAVH
jgi:hypothetical protein